MLTLNRTRAILAKLGHEPRKSLGQHFLIDANLVRKSLALAQVNGDDTVVEIGPGLGTLTQALLETGATVFGIETDEALFRYQSETLLKIAPEHLHLTLGDAVDQPRAGFPLALAKEERFKIVANLPYAIATPWLETLLAGPLPQSITIMVQKEAGERFLAQSSSKRLGAISIFLQSAYRSLKPYPVSRSCFLPPPRVDSVIVHLERLDEPYRFSSESRLIIRQIFTQRRKQLGRILKGLDQCRQPTAWLAELALFSVTPQSRPEQVPLKAWQHLALWLQRST